MFVCFAFVNTKHELKQYTHFIIVSDEENGVFLIRPGPYPQVLQPSWKGLCGSNTLAYFA